MTFSVLHVCTGNICRSPMAEALTRHLAAGRGLVGLQVSSAGTWGHDGSPMEDHALTTLAEMGIDGSGFTARELVAEHVVAADLVLGATREHRAAAVVLHPRAASRTFTLRELARLVADVDPRELPDGDLAVRGAALVRLAAERRGTAAPVHADADDLSDPYHAPASQFVRCAALIEQVLTGPLDLLAGTLESTSTSTADTA